MSTLARRRPAGFTLVELLVVIGIIALLISILLPALNKAREAANSVKCMSNMRQIAFATASFAADNRGLMPGRSAKGNVTYVTTGYGSVNKNGTDPTYTADWIAWMRRIDPFTGMPATGALDQNITYSGLARYLGIKRYEHTSIQDANNASRTTEQVFLCPSDKPEEHLYGVGDNNGGSGQYRYSYSMNNLLANPIQRPAGTNPATSGAWDVNARNGFKYTGRIGSIKKPAEVILLICEDVKTVDDGTFNPNSVNYAADQTVSMLATRHMTSRKIDTKGIYDTATKNADGVGNAAFVDGHCEKVTRKQIHSQRYSTNPTPDPVDWKF